jgi:hypothetical protein
MSLLLIDGVRYRLWTPKDEEKEFHPMIREHSKEIFGENSLYFDVRHVLKTAAGIGSIPDAYLIDLSKPYEWYVAENELSTHPVYDHSVKQLTKFINGIENQNAKSQILDMLYDEIKKDSVLRATVEKSIESTDLYHFLSKLLSKPPRIVIIIDLKTSEVEEACRVLKYQTDIVEFQTYVRENAEKVHAHLFEPLFEFERVKEEGEKKERKYPPHMLTWEKRLMWVDDNTKEIVKALTSSILRLQDVRHHPHGRYECFYKGALLS